MISYKLEDPSISSVRSKVNLTASASTSDPSVNLCPSSKVNVYIKPSS